MLLGTLFWTDEASAIPPSAITSGQNCLGCHATADNMPGLYKQYSKSAHYEKNVTCIDCHGAQADDPDAFQHYETFISVIVSPRDCQKCHETAVKEFEVSQHAKARELVTTGVGAYFLNNLAGSRHFGDDAKYAAGTNGCLRCHGSEILMDKNGHPTKETWPNSGIGRKNPDGSMGNCASCHETHEFSAAQARRPESCAICHNSEGGDPQIETYSASRHGTTYAAKSGQMNFHSREWVVGENYSAAPTCATCHMSATRDMPATHDIGKRINWSALLQETNSIAVQEKCGLPVGLKYEQPAPASEHRENMEKVCSACHSKMFSGHFFKQYEMEVRLIKEKWLEPGKVLFQLVTEVLQAAEKEKYAFLTHPIDYTWFGMCNTTAKAAHTGAAMMSPGWTEKGNGGFAAAWYSSYIPALKGIIEKYGDSSDKEVEKRVKALREKLNEIMNKKAYSGPWDIKETTPGK